MSPSSCFVISLNSESSLLNIRLDQFSLIIVWLCVFGVLFVGCSWFGVIFSVLTVVPSYPWIGKSFTFGELLVTVVTSSLVSVMFTVLT